MIRAFVAIELDAELRRAVAATQAQVRDRLTHGPGPDVHLQWVKPESMHLTLKFLGEIHDARVSEIHGALASVAQGREPFSLDIKDLGVFPDLRAPRVLWIGVSGHVESLMNLAVSVETALAARGFPPEAKPFHPHLTLARIKDHTRDVGRALAASGIMEQAAGAGTLMVKVVALMKSDLRPTGAVYAQLCAVPLKEA